MRKNSFIGLLLVVVAIAALIWAASLPGSAQKMGADNRANCNIANVGGSYAYSAFGTIFAGNAAGYPAGAYNSAARLVLDGAGNYTVNAMTSYNGVVVPEQFQGSYSVDEGCAVTYYFEFGGQNVPAVFAYMTGNRDEARAISVIPGTNITYLTVRQ